MFILAAAAVPACGSVEDDGPVETKTFEPEPIKNAAPLPTQGGLVCPKGTDLTYANFGEGFLLNYCTSCHSKSLPEGQRGNAPILSNFDTAEDVVLWRANILSTSGAETSPMPPSGNVPKSERTQLAEWLNCGAPNNQER